MEKEKVCSFALARIFANQPLVARSLVEGLGSASAVFDLDDDGLDVVFGPHNGRRDKLRGVRLEQYAESLHEAEGRGCRYLVRRDDAFPAALDMCPDAPIGFFVRSADTLENVFRPEMIAFVGTRDCSSYGRDWTARAVACLGGASAPTIVSGLAYGIDICAHRAAMENSLPTIAVLGTGIFNTYPRQHECYLRRMIERPCSAVISEYPPDVEVYASNFLCRNRIIAGLCRSTVLVESRINGGGMTTARMAFSYGREVFAVPGRNDDLRSQGCNMLIRQHMAEPLTDCESFLENLEYEASPRRGTPVDVKAFYGSTLPPEEVGCLETLYRLVGENRDIPVEELILRTGYPAPRVLSAVSRLESDSLISVDLLRRCRLAPKS